MGILNFFLRMENFKKLLMF